MKTQIVLPLRQASFLRHKIRLFLRLHESFLAGANAKTVHDLRVASRRLREALDAFQSDLPDQWYGRLKKRTKQITKTLGRLREAEVNLQILEEICKNAIVQPVVAEILFRSLRQTVKKRRKAIRKDLSDKRFQLYDSFLELLHGARIASSFSSPLLRDRINDFLQFSWHAELGDKDLHDLRIRTKKLRYALEIEKALTHQPLGRFLNRIKGLQDLLGDINDFFVFSRGVEKELSTWNSEGLIAVPAGLQQILDFVLQRKQTLYPQVYPRYAQIVSSAPAFFPLLQTAAIL